MRFTKIKPYETSTTTYWISSVYKVVNYNAGEYFAYYIPDGYPNWGENVATPPLSKRISSSPWPIRYYPDLEQAKTACIEHAKNHSPDLKTLQRANALTISLKKQQIAWKANKAEREMLEADPADCFDAGDFVGGGQ